MTLIYHVYPKDQWCDPKEGTQPFVSKADDDELGEDLRHTHATDCVRIAVLEAQCLAAEDDRDEWRALYEHGLQDRNELLGRLAALKQEKDHAIALVGHRTACLEAIEARCREQQSENERLARISLAARALLKYIDDHDWGHIPEGVTADTLRDLLTASETPALPSNWTICGKCGTEWTTSDGAVLPCPTCSEKETPQKYGTCPVCGGMGGAHFTTCRHSPAFEAETKGDGP